MLKVFLVIYNSSGMMVDGLVLPSMDKCMELSARMKMIDFSIPAPDRFSYNCKYLNKKPIIEKLQNERWQSEILIPETFA